MVSNVYTKHEIIEGLASKGHYIDSYTLDSFFEKWEIEAIFEDEEGKEFYDKNTLDFICEKLFGNSAPINQETNKPAITGDASPAQTEAVQPNQTYNNFTPQPANETKNVVNNNVPPLNQNNSLQFNKQILPQNTENVPKYDQPVQPGGLEQAVQPPQAQPQPQIQPQPQPQIQPSIQPSIQPQIQPVQPRGFEQIVQPPPVQPQIPPPIQPSIQPQIPPQPVQNMQLPFGAQQQFQSMGFQNLPYQSPQVQQPFTPFSPFPANSYPNIPPRQNRLRQDTWQEDDFSESKPDLSREFSINDSQVSKILNSVSLSDGNSLMNRLKQDIGLKDNSPNSFSTEMSNAEILKPLPSEKPVIKSGGLLGGAMEAAGIAPKDIMRNEPERPAEETQDFDDISLLSESMEAQEKFRQYVVSELAKKNVDLTPQGNEFKLDVSERTINMIARTVAKKIVKNVNALLSSGKGSLGGPLKEENEKLTQKVNELEDENKKLRLLYAETNKNLNSYKPFLFGLYRRVKISSGSKSDSNKKKKK